MTMLAEQLDHILPYEITGRVVQMTGLSAAVSGFPVPVGSTCEIRREHGGSIDAEVIAFRDDHTVIQPYGDAVGIRRGNRVRLKQSVQTVRVGDSLQGRVIDALGRFIDQMPETFLGHRVPLNPAPIAPLTRPRIDTPLGTGVRVIDGLLTCGMGQRLGIFAGSGVGKSTLLGQLAKSSTADVNVVVLVGERGREVREFIERDLGPEGLARSVVIVATSEQPALLRLRAAHLGTAVAEYFRDEGKNVLLMMDSVTRYALAQREIGLAAGEPPATRGFPPSVFSLLPRLLERSGRTEKGSITGLYTVLVEADDTNEPIADAVRGILDGHVMLSRKLAERSHWPAIDVLSSISRSMNDIVDADHVTASNHLKRLMAAYSSSEDLISIGAYQKGSNSVVDQAIQMQPAINSFLQQGPQDPESYDSIIEKLKQLSSQRANESA